MSRQPYIPDWRKAVAAANAAPRCRARCRRSKLPCGQPAIRGRAACRLHGGKGGAPRGKRKPTYDAMVKKETYIAYPQGPGPSDRAKRAQEAGLVPGTKEYNDFVLSSDQAAANPKQENILRDEFNALTKDFRTVQDAYSKIESTSATGAGDMSMLYSYVKLLDPGSVVRESEFATAAASGSFGETV